MLGDTHNTVMNKVPGRPMEWRRAAAGASNYEKSHPDVKVVTANTGSGQGIAQAF